MRELDFFLFILGRYFIKTEIQFIYNGINIKRSLLKYSKSSLFFVLIIAVLPSAAKENLSVKLRQEKSLIELNEKLARYNEEQEANAGLGETLNVLQKNHPSRDSSESSTVATGVRGCDGADPVSCASPSERASGLSGVERNSSTNPRLVVPLVPSVPDSSVNKDKSGIVSGEK